MYRLHFVKNLLIELRSEIKSWPTGQKMILYAVFISIAGGRWASYIGIPSANIFLIDLLFFGGWLASLSRFAREAVFHRFLFHSFLFSFIIFQFLRNLDSSPIIRLRDLLPYIYFFTLPVIALIFQNVSIRFLILVMRLATLLHIIWLLPVVLKLLKPITLGGPFGIPIFSDRWDQSGIAIAIGILAWKQNSDLKLNGNIRIQVLFILCGLFQWSRASLIAISISVIISLFDFSRRTRGENRKQSKLALVLAYIMMICILLLPNLSSFIPTNSVLNRLGVTDISESLQRGASETTNARQISQKLLLDWLMERDQLIMGAGPGSEMVFESGAYIYLSGDPNVRSPHSWLYGGVGRFGILGFGIWLLLLANGLRPHYRLKKIISPPLHFIIPILIVSLFGVIVESPFGSLPLVFFTAVAIREKS